MYSENKKEIVHEEENSFCCCKYRPDFIVIGGL